MSANMIGKWTDKDVLIYWIHSTQLYYTILLGNFLFRCKLSKIIILHNFICFWFGLCNIDKEYYRFPKDQTCLFSLLPRRAWVGETFTLKFCLFRVLEMEKLDSGEYETVAH